VFASAITKSPNSETLSSDLTSTLRDSRNRIGKAVKIADLVDNSDISRILTPTERDHERLAKYARALALLQ
jgi:hypothetical protein